MIKHVACYFVRQECVLIKSRSDFDTLARTIICSYNLIFDISKQYAN